MITFKEGDLFTASCNTQETVICEVVVLRVLVNDKYATSTKYFDVEKSRYIGDPHSCNRSKSLLNSWLGHDKGWLLNAGISHRLTHTMEINDELFTI